MFALVALLVAALFVGSIAYLARRARTLFHLDFTDGKLAYARGRIPKRLLQDLLQVIPEGQKAHLVVRCVIEQSRARVVTRGEVSADTLQQVRNLVGLWPLARLRTAPAISTGRRWTVATRNCPHLH